MTTNRIFLFSVIIIASTILISSLLPGCDGKAGNHAHTQVEIQIEAEIFHPANCKQYASSVALGVYNGHLYLWDWWEPNLSRFENGSFTRVAKIDGGGVGLQGQHFYYVKEIQNGKCKLYSYNLETKEHTSLINVQAMMNRGAFFTEDCLYYPIDLDQTHYRAVRDSQVLDLIKTQEMYVIGEYAYALEGDDYHANLVRYDARGAGESCIVDIPLGKKSMIPCENGLLIHNEDTGDFLYFVEADTGNVVELFTVDCIYATSAVNVHNGYAYLSFVRYTEWGSMDLAGKKNDDDELNGTYRFNLEDYSVEKISNESYNGLFIFDDTGIYACKGDDQVYKLDFEGNVLLKLTN